MMNFFLNSVDKVNETVKEKKAQTHQLFQILDATLGTNNLSAIVKLPEGEDLLEWIVCNTIDFYNQVKVLYGTLKHVCTHQSCPIMNASTKWEFLWSDGKKTFKVTAPEYVELLMEWIRAQIEDVSIVPTNMGISIPKKADSVMKQILKRLARVYAHLYYQHFDTFKELKVDVVLNTSFKHFVYFIQEFQLISKKDLMPLESLISSL